MILGLVNELPTDRGGDAVVSVVDDELPSLEELLCNATEAQASQETETYMMARSDENLKHMKLNNSHEIGDSRHAPDSSGDGWSCFPWL